MIGEQSVDNMTHDHVANGSAIGGERAKPIKSHRDLRVWNAAVDLTVSCYSTTQSFPQSEMYGLTSQIRRAASSLPANIAEGYGRETRANFIQFLRVAQGSLKELETHLIVSERFGLLDHQALTDLLSAADEIGGMLYLLIRRLQRKT